MLDALTVTGRVISSSVDCAGGDATPGRVISNSVECADGDAAFFFLRRKSTAPTIAAEPRAK
jgi:hypothetical protein